MISRNFNLLKTLINYSKISSDAAVARTTVMEFSERIRQTEDGITVLPWKDFVTQLWSQDWI
jgi:uncharacterized protein involved in exopolysaccharide biosynthesis